MMLCVHIALCSLIGATAPADDDWGWADVWQPWSLDAVLKRAWPLEYSPRVPSGAAAEDPGRDFKDPAFLYLVFKERRDEGSLLTWLHPTKRRLCAYLETFYRGRQQEARAFGVQISRESCRGYEVSFQPIDPVHGQPLPLREKIVFFPRGGRPQVQLSDKLTVMGFYGSPKLQKPW